MFQCVQALPNASNEVVIKRVVEVRLEWIRLDKVGSSSQRVPARPNRSFVWASNPPVGEDMRVRLESPECLARMRTNMRDIK